ncbi:uncharacterized protein RCC_00720 [Ramularia collo-cygni]|uniref:Uncharacterized protein n=1 Tax=Ramularia collo-cygni TaxID=112498 RepID=A0A2D3V3A9_9PEZI|nr:uncharacterized protein RCC_00720 [Ramularia collo-cygni]CZT14763.1 uncharacterized protein RCC_00720 [Ramularia collo-cygni]
MASGHHYHYHSDDSTFNGARRPRTRRYSTSPDTNYSRSTPHGRRRRTSAPHVDEEHSAASTLGKVALGVIFVQVVSTCFSMWMNKKDSERYKSQHQQERRRDFEKAKAKRRRDEERYEREEEERERRAEEREWKEASRWEREEIITEGRRIGFVETSSIHSEDSEPAAPKQLEAPPDSDRREDRARSRRGSHGAASFDDRSTGERPGTGRRETDRASRYDGRSRSRPPVDVR